MFLISDEHFCPDLLNNQILNVCFHLQLGLYSKTTCTDAIGRSNYPGDFYFLATFVLKREKSKMYSNIL